MARYNFNVNTQAKLLDIHKQFNGGLKTVDTDDALQDFYLRQAENVSISEFGFLEKRYGLAKKQTILSGSPVDSAKVQGHFIYKYGALTDEIIAIGGKLYVKHDGDTTFSPITLFDKHSSFTYPNVLSLANYSMDASNGTFQSTREIGATRVKDNLYIFTGSYPVIYTRRSIVDASELSTGTVYLMPYYVPNWNEIVGLSTGINLLIEDFDDAYGYNDLSLAPNSTYRKPYVQVNPEDPPSEELLGPVVTNIRTAHAPLIPTIDYVTENEETSIQLNLQVAFDFAQPLDLYTTFDSFTSTNTGFIWKSVTQNPKYFYPESPSAVTVGSVCPAIGTRASYQSNYYECVAASTSDVNGNTNVYYQFTPRYVYFKSAGAPTWTLVPEDNIVDRRVYTNAYAASNFSIQQSHLTTEGHFDITSPKVSFRRFESVTTIGTEIAPLQVSIAGFPVGDYDFQVVWEYERHYLDGQGDELEESLLSFTTNYNNIQIEATKINAESLGYKPNPLWTCNKVIEHYGKLMAWGSTAEPEYIFISHPKEQNWFPATATVKFDTEEDEPISAVTPFMNVLIVQSATKTWGLKGSYIVAQIEEDGTLNAEDLYAPFSISPVYGTIAPKSVRPVRNRLYFLSREGIVELTNLAFAFDDKYNVNELDRNIKNIVPRDPNAVAIQHDYQYWINFPSTGETLRYYVDKKAWVKDTYGKDENAEYAANTFDFDGVFKYYSKDGVLSFITNVTDLDTDPGVAAVYEVVVDKSLPNDFGKPFKSTFETANLNQGYPFHPKKYLENRMDFTLQNEYNTSKDAIPFTYENTSAAGVITANLLKGHSYLVGFVEDQDITNVQYSLDDGLYLDADFSYDATTYGLTFTVPYLDFEIIDIKIQHPTGDLVDLPNASLHDATYDHTINFNTWSISEEGTLNLDNIGYDATQAKIDINLGTVFGPNETWVFDESDFGNRVTAVKTVKLSGRGYNYKLYFTDRSRSKWTIESIGITFKFKRARGER